jgi:hypothetical protein
MPDFVDPITVAQADQRVRALALETGSTEAQIRTIIDLIGNDRSSIIREARALKNRRDG